MVHSRGNDLRAPTLLYRGEYQASTASPLGLLCFYDLHHPILIMLQYC
jgi:hypothetical protein